MFFEHIRKHIASILQLSASVLSNIQIILLLLILRSIDILVEPARLLNIRNGALLSISALGEDRILALFMSLREDGILRYKSVRW